MTFEEFFKKKKINLELLKTAEPELFKEFESHYALMGEKSFDHTKKYWFNQLRRRFVLPPEVKEAKVVIENKLAEQTVIESVTEVESQKAAAGFKPRFKSAAPRAELPIPDEKRSSSLADEASPAPRETSKIGFKPAFKPQLSSSPPAQQEQKPVETAETNTEAAVTMMAFKPRFKITQIPKPDEHQPAIKKEEKDAIIEGQMNAEPEVQAQPAPKLGFKPKFKNSSGTANKIDGKDQKATQDPKDPGQ
jgi:hypothetical protein